MTPFQSVTIKLLVYPRLFPSCVTSFENVLSVPVLVSFSVTSYLFLYLFCDVIPVFVSFSSLKHNVKSIAAAFDKMRILKRKRQLKLSVLLPQQVLFSTNLGRYSTRQIF